MGLRPVFCVGWRSRATASACGARAVRVPCCSLAAAARPAIGDVAALASARQPARVRDLGVRLHYVFVANTCLIGTYDFFKQVAEQVAQQVAQQSLSRQKLVWMRTL